MIKIKNYIGISLFIYSVYKKSIVISKNNNNNFSIYKYIEKNRVFIFNNKIWTPFIKIKIICSGNIINIKKKGNK